MFEKKVIIIGATSGIGRELAKVYSSNGYKVGVTGRRENLLIDLKNENPTSYIIKSFDISIPFENGKHLNELADELGGLDLIVINSGVGFENELLDFKIEKNTFDTNIIGIAEIADWSYNFFR
jgi:short-subunit dehydrogenase